MTRTKFRQLWMLVSGVMLLATSYAHNHYKDTEIEIDRKKKSKDLLNIELRTGKQMTSALVELDSVTLNENKSTRLDILRYLGLEESQLAFTTQAAVERKVVNTPVMVRKFSLKGEMPYAKALEQADFFYNLKKVTVHKVTISKAKGYGDIVTFELKGSIYGLQK